MDLTSPLVTLGRAVGICMSNVNPHVAASTGHQRAGTAPPYDEEPFFNFIKVVEFVWHSMTSEVSARNEIR